jgi:hypothetical protein
MKTKFYYFRNKKRSPVVTICIIENNGIYSRGIAFCSEMDNSNKSVGRSIAFKRALQSIIKKQDLYKINRKGKIRNIVNSCVDNNDLCSFVLTEYKALYDVFLTKFEEKIFGIKKLSIKKSIKKEKTHEEEKYIKILNAAKSIIIWIDFLELVIPGMNELRKALNEEEAIKYDSPGEIK